MRIFVVDAFSDRPFTGNPAGVCLLESAADEAWMQAVAAEMKHSETAFTCPVGDTGADFELRWFTPEVEVDLCGHATLASAHVLHETGAVPTDRPIRFRTLRSGVLTTWRDRGGRIEMDFPACPADRVEAPAGLAGMLGAEVAWTGRNAQDDLLVELSGGEEAVRGLEPDLEALAGLGGRGIIVTSLATPGRSYEYVSRFFAPAVGVGEDPVTGSAHCALAPYWAERLGRRPAIGYQASARGGHVHAAVEGDRVRLGGAARTVLDGVLQM